ncbi:MAG: hypothetical protein JNM62_04430 [Flavobacteriales bacterium]|nr:hypothetical protein [Flavobacteriales bacterium]
MAFSVLNVFCWGIRRHDDASESVGVVGVLIWFFFVLVANVQYKPGVLKLCWTVVLVLQAVVGVLLMQHPEHLSVNGSWACAMLYAPVALPVILCLDRLNWFLHKDHFKFPIRGDMDVELTGRTRNRAMDYVFGMLSYMLPVLIVELGLARFFTL